MRARLIWLGSVVVWFGLAAYFVLQLLGIISEIPIVTGAAFVLILAQIAVDVRRRQWPGYRRGFLPPTADPRDPPKSRE